MKPLNPVGPHKHLFLPEKLYALSLESAKLNRTS